MLFLDLSDHTLTTIGTWAEVAILVFMLYEHYAPRIKARLMGASVIIPSNKWSRFLADNRTPIIALVGLAIVIWLHWGQDTLSKTSYDNVVHERDRLVQEVQTANRMVTELRNNLSNTQESLDVAKQRFSVNLTANLLSQLGLAERVTTIPKTFVIVTSDDEANKPIARQIEDILNGARGVSSAKSALLPTGLPHYERDLDAPRLKSVGTSGITIHGRNDAGNILFQVFSNCFITHQTRDTPTDVLDYWKRIYPKTTEDINNITWIDIGKGSAWKIPNACN